MALLEVVTAKSRGKYQNLKHTMVLETIAINPSKGNICLKDVTMICQKVTYKCFFVVFMNSLPLWICGFAEARTPVRCAR